METLNDPVFALFEETPSLTDITISKSGNNWETQLKGDHHDDVGPALSKYINDMFYTHTLPVLSRIKSLNGLQQVHYHREENGEPIRTYMGHVSSF